MTVFGVWAIVAQTAFSASDTPPPVSELAPGVYVVHGAVNTGVFVREGAALLLDCGEDVTPEQIAALGADRVELICLTQHRRPNAMGAYRFVEEHGTPIVVSEAARLLFEDTDAYWNDWHNRWHIYHMQPGPQVLSRPLKPNRTIEEGDTVEWRGLTLHVLATPGATEGAVSYWAAIDGKRLAFIGDTMYAPGQVLDLFSLQKGFRKVGDYHGFLGMREPLVESLHKLAAAAPDLAVPSHGAPFDGAARGAALLEERLDALFRNYVSISALNHYFPSQFEELADEPSRMPRAEQLEPPPWVRRVAYTSFAVIADSGDALLIDCGNESVLTTLDGWKRNGTLRSVEACWITHYHDDHVDSLQRLAARYCPIMADARMAEILEHPHRFYLPCIAPVPVPVARKTADGETWTWREFTLTALHFPGQTLYHGGLLVEGHGAKVFFAGDSGAPTGLDDYCAANRNFLGAGRGSRHCLDLWRSIQPDFIFNQHQDKPFRFSESELDRMDQVLAEREELIEILTPWGDANFAIDEHWIRAYPYEQETAPGDAITIQLHVTNHGEERVSATVRPFLPSDWEWIRDADAAATAIPPRTDGWVGLGAARPDAVLAVAVRVPANAPPGLYVVPFSVNFGEWKLSAYRHALVRVR